jgi:hypothetical protein
MKRRIRVTVLIMGLALSAAAQNNPPSQPEPNPAPVPGYGQNAPVLNPENPPVTGLDVPRLDLAIASRSFVSPALQVSESADTNGGNRLGSTSLESITRILGALDLQKFWPKSDLFLEYLGGGAFYTHPLEARQLQALGAEALTRWRTGQVSVRDSFSYVPDGSFQIGTYGGAPGYGLATGGGGIGEQSLPGGHLFGGNQLGSVGNIPRLSNTAIVDAIQSVDPRSAFTVAGGFSNAHFYDPTHTLLNSDQTSAEGGYSRLISRQDQLGGIYAFQLFRFAQTTGGEIYTHTMNVRWSHVISGKLSLIAGAGPQYTQLRMGGSTNRWSASGQFQLRYKWNRASLVAIYEKYTTSGSGFFGGADTQTARLGYKRPLGRTWDMYLDLGYSRNKALQNLALFGLPASTYHDGSAGVVFRKHIGRTYDFFAAYRFSEVAFNIPVCIAGCGRIAQRHLGLIGLEWHPAPTRIE